MRWIAGILLALIVAVGASAAFAWLGGLDIPLATLRAKYAAPDSQFVTIDGVQLHVRDTGRGPVLLLIHGHYQSLRVWDAWAERMQGQLRVVRFDMPPYGLSGPDASGRYGPARVEALLGQLIAHYDLHDIALGGSSTGSAIALRYALAHPDQVKKLILVNAPLVPVPPAMQARFPAYMNLLETWVFKPIYRPRFFYSFLLHRLFADPAKLTPGLIDETYDMMRKPGAAADLALFTRSLSFSDPSYKAKTQTLHQQLGAVRMPTLVLWGGSDSMLPASLAGNLKAALSGTAPEVIVYPGTGHFLPIEAPGAAADVQRFVTGRAP